jgi:hypothetical protein
MGVRNQAPSVALQCQQLRRKDEGGRVWACVGLETKRVWTCRTGSCGGNEVGGRDVGLGWGWGPSECGPAGLAAATATRWAAGM